MNRNENPRIAHPTGVRLGRWVKAGLLSVGVVFGILLTGAQTAQADDWRYGYRPYYSNYGYAYDGYGYSASPYYYDYYNDPYHYYSSRRSQHYGPHSAPHVGPHLHWQHGYHWGPHWQRHYDHHGSGGHWGYRPWRPH